MSYKWLYCRHIHWLFIHSLTIKLKKVKETAENTDLNVEAYLELFPTEENGIPYVWRVLDS